MEVLRSGDIIHSVEGLCKTSVGTLASSDITPNQKKMMTCDTSPSFHLEIRLRTEARFRASFGQVGMNELSYRISGPDVWHCDPEKWIGTRMLYARRRAQTVD